MGNPIYASMRDVSGSILGSDVQFPCFFKKRKISMKCRENGIDRLRKRNVRRRRVNELSGVVAIFGTLLCFF